MALRPGDYPWSSYAANAQGQDDALTRRHDVYLSLGGDDAERQRTYRELFRERLNAADSQSLRTGINLCVPVGGDRFKSQIERRLKLRISYKPKGRPRKEPQEEN